MAAPYAGQFITPGRFAGKVAVVTGSAQGIGQKVAERIGAEGGASGPRGPGRTGP